MATAMPFVAAGMQVVGGFVKAAGDMAGANAGSAMALTTARINQQFKQEQADVATKLSTIAYERTRRQGLMLKGKSIAMMAEAGIDIGQGTPLDILSQQAAENEYAAEVQRFNLAEQAWKLSTQGMLDIQEGDTMSEMYQQRGKAAALGDIISGITGAAATASTGLGAGGEKPGGSSSSVPATNPIYGTSGPVRGQV